MHEMALAGNLVEILRDESAKQSFTRVIRLKLKIGTLSHVDPRALAFGFETMSKGTLAEGAEVEIETTPAKAFCVACSREVTIEGHADPCPHCGSFQRLLTEGDEMQLVELEVK